MITANSYSGYSLGLIVPQISVLPIANDEGDCSHSRRPGIDGDEYEIIPSMVFPRKICETASWNDGLSTSRNNLSEMSSDSILDWLTNGSDGNYGTITI